MSKLREAMFWSTAENGYVRCGLCPHRCLIAENATGVCGVRGCSGGELVACGYGIVSSTALDPIEKKPLYRFHPGKRVLSIGGFGCNLRCPFCQNYEISMRQGEPRQGDGSSVLSQQDRGTVPLSFVLHKTENRPLSYPKDVARIAVETVKDGNVGVAYTYNEPLIGYEFLYDCATLVREAGLHNVLVTNGFINREPLETLLPFIDAMNIDLKGFTESFYRRVGGNLQTVMDTISLAQKHCHVEVTTLVIPGENEDDIEELAKWLSSIDPGIPLHLSRFFPRFKYSDREPTPRETILRLSDVAKKYLRHVYAGNMR